MASAEAVHGRPKLRALRRMNRRVERARQRSRGRAFLGTTSPERRDRVLPNRRIDGDQRQIIAHRLHDQHAVERILVVAGQSSRRDRVPVIDRELGRSENRARVEHETLGPADDRNLPARVLDPDFLERRSRDEHVVGGGDRLACVRREPMGRIEGPQPGVRVEEEVHSSSPSPSKTR